MGMMREIDLIPTFSSGSIVQPQFDCHEGMITFFGITAYLGMDGHSKVAIREDWKIKLNPEDLEHLSQKKAIEDIIDSDKKNGNYEKIAAIVINPIIAVLLFLEKAISEKDFRRITVAPDRVSFYASICEKEFLIIVMGKSDDCNGHRIATIGWDGEVL